MAKILVIDDEEHIRFLYKEEFQDEGFEVVTADTPIGGLELITREKPDILILDVRFPYEISGLDFLCDLRDKYSISKTDLPVIICTAYDEYMNDMKTTNANDFVLKSFDLTNLKKIVYRLLEGHRPAV